MEKRKIRAEHATEMDKVKEDYMGEIQEVWGDGFLGGERDTNTGPRGEFAEGLMKQLALMPIESAKKRADTKLGGLSDSLSLEDLDIKLREINEEFTGEAIVMAAMMRAYFEELTQYKHSGEIDAKILARMKSSAVNIGKMADALILTQEGEVKGSKGLTGLRDALKFSLGVTDITQSNYIKAKDGIIEAIEKGDEQVKAFGWMAITFMDKENKMKFAKDYSKKLKSDGEIKGFIEDASRAGALSFLELEEVLGKGKYDSLFSVEKKEAHAAFYKAQYDYADEVKEFMGESYGAYNQTGSMLNFKNVFLSILLGGGVFSAVFSTGLDLFKGGKIKSAEGIVSSIVNVQNGIKVGAAYLAYELMKNNPTKVGIEDVTEVEDVKFEAAANLKNTLTPTWNKFFKSDGHKGASAFGDWSEYAFTNYKGNALDGYLTLANFKQWMKTHNVKDKYSKSMAKIKDGEEGDKKAKASFIDGGKITNEEVKIFAASFRTLDIGADDAKTTYDDALTKVD